MKEQCGAQFSFETMSLHVFRGPPPYAGRTSFCNMTRDVAMWREAHLDDPICAVCGEKTFEETVDKPYQPN